MFKKKNNLFQKPSTLTENIGLSLSVRFKLTIDLVWLVLSRFSSIRFVTKNPNFDSVCYYRVYW